MSDTQQQQQGDSEFKVYSQRAGIGAEHYNPPRMFERFVDFGDDVQRWRYVRDEMVALAKKGILCLTDLLNQEPDVADCCGDVLYNRVLMGRKEHKQKYFTDPLPIELMTRCIHVRSLNGETVKWCKDMVGGNVMRRGRADTENGARRVEAQIVDTLRTDVMLTPQEAWMCLKESGKFVVRAKRADHQSRAWKCEEVRPEAPASEVASKSKKSFAEANRQ